MNSWTQVAVLLACQAFRQRPEVMEEQEERVWRQVIATQQFIFTAGTLVIPILPEAGVTLTAGFTAG